MRLPVLVSIVPCPVCPIWISSIYAAVYLLVVFPMAEVVLNFGKTSPFRIKRMIEGAEGLDPHQGNVATILVEGDEVKGVPHPPSFFIL